jgi:hypothetical protein
LRRRSPGASGLIEGMRPDTAFFDIATHSVAMARKIDAAFGEKNLDFALRLMHKDVEVGVPMRLANMAFGE